MSDQVELSRELKRLEQLSAQAQTADPQRALALAQEARRLAEQLGEREWLARCALQVGEGLQRLS